MTIENEMDWKMKARKSIVDNALEYIVPAQNIRDLELTAFYVVASIGRIKEAKQEKLLDDLYGFSGSFKDLKQKTVETIRKFLQRYIK